MKAILFFAILAASSAKPEFPALDVLSPKTSPETQADTVTKMVQRVIGARANEFTITVTPSLTVNGKEAFLIQTVAGHLTVTGTTGIAAAMGFYYYIKFYCNSIFTWGGQNINLPYPLPPVKNAILKDVLDRFRYYQNVCTVSYSFAFWNWSQWERHLDWMAMSGINLPLAFTGQEAIFQRLYLNMGFTQSDLDEFFGGPAFLAWSRLGNIQGWGGPLPQSWITNKLVLQHRILNRMRDFGMIPVLPAFAGHVPPAITRVFPNAKVSRLGGWAGFNETYSATFLLDFEDPLFEKIGSQFIKLMESEFGIDHIYNADTFNEMQPKSNATDYLAASGRAVFNAMQVADPDAVWLMQGWLFMNKNFWKDPQINALVNSVPKGRMVILDLMSEMAPFFYRTKSYFGQPFIWCMLHNFGGTSELFGSFDLINDGPPFGRNFTESSTMVGLGLTMEGIFQNEVVYEFMMENAYTPQARNITQWISTYPLRRYNFTSPEIDKAWQLLKASVYNRLVLKQYHGKTGFVLRPDIIYNHEKSSVYNCTNFHHDNDYALITNRPSLYFNPAGDLWYDPEQLFEAWDHLLAATGQFKPTELFMYDVVDVTRNSLQALSLNFYFEIISSFQANDTIGVRLAGDTLVTLLKDLDVLLASDRHFLLGPWIRDAVSWAENTQESLLLQMNARNQITIWGPRGEIVDYAAKQWSGLMKDYYAPRWQFFVDYLIQVINNETKFDGGKYQYQILHQVELPFTLAVDPYPTYPMGNSLEIVKQLYVKYRPMLKPALYHKLSALGKAEKAQQKSSPFSYHQVASTIPLGDELSWLKGKAMFRQTQRQTGHF